MFRASMMRLERDRAICEYERTENEEAPLGGASRALHVTPYFFFLAAAFFLGAAFFAAFLGAAFFFAAFLAMTKRFCQT